MKLFKYFFQKFQNYYKHAQLRRISFQRKHWRKQLAQYDWDNSRLYGYDWGDPEDSNDRLGNYLELKNRLIALTTPQTTILEIGSLGGKWTQYIRHAHKIICADINDLGFEYIKKKIHQDNIEFYLTKGDELYGIADQSVDVIFSLDSLVRAPKRCIKNYFKESARVLKQSGVIFFHLPCNEIEFSKKKGFTNLSLNALCGFCKDNKFEQVNIDMGILKHGVLLQAVKP